MSKKQLVPLSGALAVILFIASFSPPVTLPTPTLR